MEQDKFTHIFRLPGSIQVRIAKWQQTFRGKSDLVLHQALVARNRQYKQADFQPKGWCVNLFDPKEISITHHGDYIQTAMRTMVDRKVSYKRIYLSRMPLEQATEELRSFKLAWIKKHNIVAKHFNQIQKETFLNYAREEIETLYPAIPDQTFERAVWNRIVSQEFGSEKSYEDPYFVIKKAQKPQNKVKNHHSKSPDKPKQNRRFRPKHSDSHNIRHP
ncbi:hypothetical protein VOA_001991 [Vibrio sp. RC586]|uniref:MSHA operon transcriptional regulator n=1 Tax=Vibrio sp. RC586 TaxID=675815 RepID=UPI0001BB8348|nr:hypothetical protein [Vibrio sp. RC586]EEY98173.1 hypothetical protein VOA_001991 [Vibrio sp. RC586]